MKRNNITQKQRSNFFSLLFALSSLLFVSCEQVEDFSQETDADAVKVVASINNLQTRVAYEDDGATNFINGDEICVQNILRETKNIATYTFYGSTWTTIDALVWNGGTAESQFQAWYPATASFDKFTLPTDQNSREELPAADWMTASTRAMVKPADKTINLAFEHKLAKVTVQITEFTSQFGDDPRLMAATIYSLSDEYVTVNGGIKPVLGGNAATAIVCPGRYAVDENLMEVTISDDGRQTFLNVPVNAFLTDTGLEAGKHYTFSLKVGKDAISITKVNVEPWTTKEIDGGVAEELIPNPIDATTMSTNALNTAVAEELARGIRNLEVTLAPDASAEMITAIRRAICDTEGVIDGSINLTLKGVTTIPDNSESLDQGYPIFGGANSDDSGEYEEVTQLASVNLPDVLTIGDVAFSYCKNLTTVTAPKVQTIGMYAFYGTVLTSVNLPEATAIDDSAFAYGRDIREFNLPKVTVLGENALDIANPNGEVTMYLTSADEIEVHKYCFYALEVLGNLDTKVNLVLNINKQSQVNENTWTTKDADGNEVSFTFKSITFVGE